MRHLINVIRRTNRYRQGTTDNRQEPTDTRQELTDNRQEPVTFTFGIQRATLETCDQCDI